MAQFYLSNKVPNAVGSGRLEHQTHLPISHAVISATSVQFAMELTILLHRWLGAGHTSNRVPPVRATLMVKPDLFIAIIIYPAQCPPARRLVIG